MAARLVSPQYSRTTATSVLLHYPQYGNTKQIPLRQDIAGTLHDPGVIHRPNSCLLGGDDIIGQDVREVTDLELEVNTSATYIFVLFKSF